MVHYGANPMDAFPRIPRHHLAAAVKASSGTQGVTSGTSGGGVTSATGTLARLALLELKKLVAGFQAAVGRGSTITTANTSVDAGPVTAKSSSSPSAASTTTSTIISSSSPTSTSHDDKTLTTPAAAPPAPLTSVKCVLWGGDALALCSGCGALPAGARFHAIDVSNIPDHVGFANCLLLAGPRLVEAATSRLYVDLMVWSTSGAGSMQVCWGCFWRQLHGWLLPLPGCC